MKALILATLFALISFSAFAQYRPDRRPHPGPGHYRPGPGHYRPHPGPGPYRPHRGPYRPGPGHRPYPGPRPAPAPICRVLMIDNWHAIHRTYTGNCNVVMNQCLRERGYGLRCVQERGRW